MLTVMHKKDSAKGIGEVIAGILSNITGQHAGDPEKPKEILFEEDIKKIWEEMVGKQAAKHSRPTSIRKGKLTVLVTNSSWLYELSTKKQELLDHIKTKIKKEITEIHFKIGQID